MRRYTDFKTFYQFYLTQHQHPISRLLHGIGSVLVLICLFATLLSHHLYWLLLAPVCGYGFAWMGHFIFEKNKPATFQHPFYSLLADFVLLKDMLMGSRK